MFCFKVLALTSNFGESNVLETTTRREVDTSPTPATTTTEFYPSQTHNINFDFDSDQQQKFDQQDKDEGPPIVAIQKSLYRTYSS